MTPWVQYRKLKNKDISLMKNKKIIDTRRILDKSNLKIKYYAVGKGNLHNPQPVAMPQVFQRHLA